MLVNCEATKDANVAIRSKSIPALNCDNDIEVKIKTFLFLVLLILIRTRYLQKYLYIFSLFKLYLNNLDKFNKVL